jgi:hypothetical protein
MDARKNRKECTILWTPKYTIKNMFNIIFKRSNDSKHLDQGLRCQLGDLFHFHYQQPLEEWKEDLDNDEVGHSMLLVIGLEPQEKCLEE